MDLNTKLDGWFRDVIPLSLSSSAKWTLRISFSPSLFQKSIQGMLTGEFSRSPFYWGLLPFLFEFEGRLNGGGEQPFWKKMNFSSLSTASSGRFSPKSEEYWELSEKPVLPRLQTQSPLLKRRIKLLPGCIPISIHLPAIVRDLRVRQLFFSGCAKTMDMVGPVFPRSGIKTIPQKLLYLDGPTTPRWGPQSGS